MTHTDRIHELEHRLNGVKKAGRYITVIVAILALSTGLIIGKQRAETDGWAAGWNSGYAQALDTKCGGLR